MTNFTAIIFATVVRVIDGDSFVVNLPCDIPVICKNIEVRVAHIDTPELRSKCPAEKLAANEARLMAEKLLPVGSSVAIASPKRDKYFRLLVEVPKVSDALLLNGLARPYEGGKKGGWC
jgi:endonuclease YncB( thermonuclease family)